jgi:hypothetical protein
MDMMDVYYPDSSDDEKFFIPPPPNDTFITSWCRNGHGLRIEPEAVVHYLVTFQPSPYYPSADNIIIRNGHGHPKMCKGVVQTINHAEKTVQIIPEEDLGAVVSIAWDLVVGREDSRHRDIPLALMGTNDPGEAVLGWMMRKTLDFEDIKHKMTDIKPLYVNHLLAGRCIIPSQGSLASIALKSLIKKISLQAVEERVSFFAVAERVCIHDSH